jgi:uncharacterized protein
VVSVSLRQAALKTTEVEMAEVDVLSMSKCRQLLGGGVFGRLGLCTAQGPLILPVNYSVVSESVVFRTAADGVVSRHDWTKRVAFEVDHVDYAEQRGWSVLAVGLAQQVTDDDELALIRRSWEPRPWAGGARPLYVRLRWEQLTGRRLGSHWTYAQEMPVRRQV